jgi:hypothetical protein
MNKYYPIAQVLLLIIISTMISYAQAFTPPTIYHPLDVIEGAGLYKTQLANGNEAYLQVIDLRKMQMEQMIGEVDEVGFARGQYYGEPGSYYSPYFPMKLFSEVWSDRA